MMRSTSIISIKDVKKSFVLPQERAGSVKELFTSLLKGKRKSHKQQVLKGIDIDIQEGDFFGIVGRNGSGKSTLLKIIAQIYQPSSGSIEVKGKLVPFIELGVGFNPELTGRENVYLNGAILGFSKKQIDKNYQTIVDFAELEQFMDQKLKNYSSGMQVRLAFSCATMANADILLIDEVLVVGDADFQRKCFEYFRSLKRLKKTVVFVSHDMNAVKDYCDKAVLIEKGKIVHSGKARDVANEYTKMFLSEEYKAENENDSTSRWGSRELEFTNIKAKKQLNEEKKLTISARLKAYKNVQNPVIGFSIRNSTGLRIIGTNNDLDDINLGSIKKGSNVNISWELPNIFNDGVHYISVAAESNKHEPLDWWEDAESFVVKRGKTTGFINSVPIETKVVGIK